MPFYRVPVVYTMLGSYVIEADSPEEAAEKALHDEQGLPEDAFYLDESIQIDENEPILTDWPNGHYHYGAD